MLISVIVPVYNVEKYLRECLDSILNQTYKKLEIIVVDDGSTDSSGKICDEYEKNFNNIKVIHKKNEGLGMARNTGLENINGEYVTFVDSDDYIDKDLIETLYNNLLHQNVDMCKSGFKRVDDRHKILNITKYDNILYKDENAKKKMLPRMIGSLPDKKDSIEMCVWGVLYKTSHILEHNLRFPSEREMISEDLIFNIEYMQHTKGAAIIDYVGYNYRYNNFSLTTKYREDRFEASKFLYIEVKKKMLSLDYDESIILRLSRMFFIYIRMSLTQETHKISNKNYMSNIKNIYKICSDELVIDAIKSYPIKKLGIKQRIFIYLIKFRCVNIIYYLSSINII